MCVFGWLRLVEKIEKIVLKIEKCYTPFKNINSWLSCDTYLYVCSFWSTKWATWACSRLVQIWHRDWVWQQRAEIWYRWKKKIPQEFSFKLSFFFFYSLVKPPFLVLFKDTFAVNYSWQRSNSILWVGGGEAFISYMSGTGRKDFLLQKWHWELNKFTLKETCSNQRLFFTSFKTLV